MKAVKINLAGRVRYLAFTGEAMFQMRDKFGGTSQLLDNMKADTREGFSIACEAAALLAEQGELVRRNFGYDPEPILDASTIAATAAPNEIVALKLAIPAAISLGYGREVEPENDEVDLGLAELNTQKKNEVTRVEYLREGIAAGLSPKDALLMPPGEVADLFELYLRARGVRRRTEPEDE